MGSVADRARSRTVPQMPNTMMRMLMTMLMMMTMMMMAALMTSGDHLNGRAHAPPANGRLMQMKRAGALFRKSQRPAALPKTGVAACRLHASQLQQQPIQVQARFSSRAASSV